MNNNILVGFFTKGGATEKYAEIIAKTLITNEFVVETCNLANNIPDVSSYDIIILGTGVRMFRVYRRWRKVLKQKALGNKYLFLFLSSGTAIEDPDKAVEKYLHPLIEKYNLKPNSMVSFPGKIPEKWAKLDDKKETMMPDKAKDWAYRIVNEIKSK